MALRYLIPVAVLRLGLTITSGRSWCYEIHRLVNGQAEEKNGSEKAVVVLGYSANPEAIPQADLTELYSRTGPMAWCRVSLVATRLAVLWLRAWEGAGKPTSPR
ncbi:MAG: hypothetical protein ACETWG_11990 [Candidatus Neomarinimicrobiota bacterium]